MHHPADKARTHPETGSKGPSRAVLSAALSGLLGVGVAACGDPGITKSTTDPSMTLEKFTAECDARHGKVELHAHCGGANSCKGLSYDTDTHVLTEHDCKGLNTCAGYSCVVPD